MKGMEWERQYREVYQRAAAAYAAGARTPEACVAAADRAFLATLGANAQELFDYVEDASWGGEPTLEEVLGVTALRREWFVSGQGGSGASRPRPMAEFPAKADMLEGIAWLPRIIAKAEARLRGELPAELMYGCGGDRAFLAGVGMGLTEFLTLVRDAGGDTARVVGRVKARVASGPLTRRR